MPGVRKGLGVAAPSDPGAVTCSQPGSAEPQCHAQRLVVAVEKDQAVGSSPQM